MMLSRYHTGLDTHRRSKRGRLAHELSHKPVAVVSTPNLAMGGISYFLDGALEDTKSRRVSDLRHILRLSSKSNVSERTINAASRSLYCSALLLRSCKSKFPLAEVLTGTTFNPAIIADYKCIKNGDERTRCLVILQPDLFHVH
jgi:hypothetical protein